MDKLTVSGGRRLSGGLKMPSAKNAALPIIACCLMSREDVLIKNCPRISDVHNMLAIINGMGGTARFEGGDIFINCRNAAPTAVDSDLTGAMRSSVFILGPVLSRFKTARISYPGGCNIGARPIDIHIAGLKSLSVKAEESNGAIMCDGAALAGAEVTLAFPSVGATENLIMAGVLAKGETVIRGAAREPEIEDLQNFINALGGRVSGAGSDTVVIEGVKVLYGGEYTPITDRITAGTFLTACAACGGDVALKGADPRHLGATLGILERVGARIITGCGSVRLKSNGKVRAAGRIETRPFPGFATDMQPQITALLTIAGGVSEITENLFESRFKYTDQLIKLGASIAVSGRRATVRGVKRLSAGAITAEDLRGGAALIIAAMLADGTSEISGIHHVDRGYFRIEDSLKALGAEVGRRVSAEVKSNK